MKISALNQPLGMGRGAGYERDNLAIGIGVYQPKLWIVPAIGAGVGLASSLFGGISASNAAREAERRQRQQEAKENAWYNRRYNEDYVDTAAGQNLVRRAKEYAKENWKKAAGAQAVAGGTDAATAMAKEAGNKMVGDSIANIAATDQARKEHVDDLHRQAESQFAQMDMNRELQRAQSITDAAQGASNAIMSVAGALDGAGKNLQGGSNNSKVNISPAVHEGNLQVKPSDLQPFSHTDDDLLARMAGAGNTSTKPNLQGGSNNSKVTSPASPVVAPNAITQAATGTGERFNADLKVPDMGDTIQPTITDDEYRHFRQAVGQ